MPDVERDAPEAPFAPGASMICTCGESFIWGEDSPCGHHVFPPRSWRDARVSFRQIVAAREALAVAEQNLRDAVAAARDAGDTWAVIGAAMGTTRQSAHERFAAYVDRGR